MWRGVVVCVVLWVGALSSATALAAPGPIQCSAFLYSQLAYYAPTTEQPHHKFGYANSAGAGVPHVISAGNNTAFLVGQNTGVALGDACPSGTMGVAMSISDYNVMIQSAAVKSYLGVLSGVWEGHAMMIVAVVALLLGFWVGHKLVQRGSSQ